MVRPLLETAETIPSDEVAWAGAAASGDPHARRKLVEHLLPRVRRTLSYLSQNSTETDDLTQMGMIQLLRTIHQFRGECTLAYWADRVAVRTAAKHFEKRNRRDRLWRKSGFTHVTRDGSESPSQEELADQRRLRRRLVEILGQMPAHNSVALVAFYLHDYSIAEVADLVGCPVNTIRGRLSRGRKAIKKALEADPSFAEWIQGRK